MRNGILDIHSFIKSAARLNEGDYSKDDIKRLAFLVAEAARFEIVEHACFVLLHIQDERLHWEDWECLLRSWSKLSKLGHDHVTVPDGVLIVPVGIKMTQGNIYDDNVKINQNRNYVNDKMNELHQKIENLYSDIEIIPFGKKRLNK